MHFDVNFCSTKAPVQRNLLMLYLQCDGDVLPTKLRPVKIEDENEND
jgi:hypothetical protein